MKEIPSVVLVPALKAIDFDKRKRTGGLVTHSRIFGYAPREQIRKDYCSSTSLARDYPNEHKIVCDFAADLSRLYEKYCPDMYDTHFNQVHDKIKNDWIIEGSPFTSGIINKNSALKYHVDKGNIRDVFSNMICFRKDVVGGHLAIPEYNIGLDIADKSVLFFNGQKILHGVTPFRIRSIEGYRYTLVYYSLQQMWKCQTVTEELARIKNRKTEREVLRYKQIANKDLTYDEAFKIKELTRIAAGKKH
jgi:Oxygenase domain of the 2OGFeDO superfamily